MFYAHYEEDEQKPQVAHDVKFFMCSFYTKRMKALLCNVLAAQQPLNTASLFIDLYTTMNAPLCFIKQGTCTMLVNALVNKMPYA